MQFEELRAQWQQLDRKLDQSLAMQGDLIRQFVVRPARRRVNRLAFWPAVDVGFAAIGLLLAGSTLGDNWCDWRVVSPALVLMLGAIGLLGSSVRQLIHVGGLDWSGPVAEIQASLERLRIAKIRQFKWVILFSPLMGFCGLIVGLHALVGAASGGGADIIDKLNPAWIVANYLFGVLFVPVGYIAARLLAQRYHGHRWWQSWVDDIAGKSLAAAKLDVERWVGLGDRNLQ